MIDLPAKGSCQCGTCSYSIGAKPYVAYACHCTECQKLTASAFLACMHVPVESLTITSGSPVARKRVGDSGNVLETRFCPACGSTLFAKNSSRPKIRTIHIGTLDHPEVIDINTHIWVKRKLPWVSIPEHHRSFEGTVDWTKEYNNQTTTTGENDANLT